MQGTQGTEVMSISNIILAACVNINETFHNQAFDSLQLQVPEGHFLLLFDPFPQLTQLICIVF